MNKINDLACAVPTLELAAAFIWQEAELLDGKRYEEWSALWSADGLYVIPIDPDTTDFEATLNYAHDDARMRAMRIERLTSGHSVSAVDAARTVRTVSRFAVVEAAEDVIEVRSAQILVAYKREVQTLFAADLTHRLRMTPAGLRMDQKVVRLINSTDALHALGFLL
ncbi:aromatic-ring-hydroxylating dioxygenase subunit beta [Cupriavidus sp. TA19]|uniref:aromatic-ring-hydroxylating dioxygenase subunit beta n=1 Tax=unclassified Cupriavidus TaxID=2640874 RepID=UPI000E2E5ABD|nr:MULTISPECIES: aromatic-ring-hydroxylating dioxygenase subunit beta [unclassified Cupriavidus]BDB29893.1 aromatic-ring-hydroxylating dioxygenase subunit beta [Cupriavidus sp. P-10]GLC95994.1 aromatic-ring-hydroxylating dioxygenase subunit beta [Cupriavidus sp. TA19]